MTIGDVRQVKGYVTQDKFLVGRSLADLDRYLGFHSGRLARGATFIKLDRLPAASEFELAAYSMTAEHKHSPPAGLDVSRLKALAMSRWSLTGPERLIKVVPALGHDASMKPDDQYPPGWGVPQWKLLVPLPGTVVAEVNASMGTYRPGR